MLSQTSKSAAGAVLIIYIKNDEGGCAAIGIKLTVLFLCHCEPLVRSNLA